MINNPRIEIQYCAKCNYLFRATWMAQEVLNTFETEVGEVALIPGHGGMFDVYVDSQLIFSRHEAKRFPESLELKEIVRDRVNSKKQLGHHDQP